MNRFRTILAATALTVGAFSLSASASSVSFASGTSTVTYTNAGGSGTASIVSSSPYSNTVAGSQWISYDPNTQSTGDPSAVTAYFLTLNGLTGYTGSISVAADDFTAVKFNGVTLGSSILPYDTLVTFSNLSFGAVNTFEFDVNNSAGGPTGLDFGGSASNVTPEPSSLILLGSGLVSAAGMVIRKRRTKV